MSNYHNIALQYYKHMLKARKTTIFHKALKNKQTKKKDDEQRDSQILGLWEIALPRQILLSLTHKWKSVSQRLESHCSVYVSRHMFVWVPESPSNANVPTPTPWYATITPDHQAARKLHLINWISLDKTSNYWNLLWLFQQGYRSSRYQQPAYTKWPNYV